MGDFIRSYKFTDNELKMLQNLPYEIKVEKTKIRIREWYEGNQGNVGVSFSGGLDSTVLLHLARTVYPDIPAISVINIECDENRELIKNTENVIELRSEKTMVGIVKEFGIPIGSKMTAKNIERLQNPTEKNAASRNLALTGMTRAGNECSKYKLPKKWRKLIDSPFKVSAKCCYYIKEKPQIDYANKTGVKYFIGTKASDSITRATAYKQTGCNTFDEEGNGVGKSKPLGFWNDQDVLRYIVENKVKYSKAYGDIIFKNGIYKTTRAGRTGCFMCLFGLQLEKEPNRLQRMQVEEPKKYNFTINVLGYGKILDYMGIHYRIDQIKEYRGILPNQIEFEL